MPDVPAEPAPTSTPARPPWSPAVAETHISVLFFVGDRVYKLRKPVRFGFVDFTEREEREADCHREVECNSLYAPDVYLGVLDVYERDEPVDHLVVMRRLPEDRRLATLVAAGAEVRDQLRQIVKLVVDVDQRAPRQQAVDERATRDAVSRAWQRDARELEPYVGSVIDPSEEAELQRLVGAYLAGRGPLFRARIASGRIREGHGDLRAEDIFCLDDGPRILDCVEFDENLRYGDVLVDLAFLAMDLEHLGHPALAYALFASYAEYSNDAFPRSLTDHYSAARAYVRAKVACLGGAARAREAQGYHALALGCLRRSRIRLVLVGGLPGTGKSTLAEALGTELDMVVLHSDEVRRELVSARTQPAGQSGRYSEEETAATYATLCARARLALGSGQSVVLDASWTSGALRAEARRLAVGTFAELVELRCEAPGPVAAERIGRRLITGDDASEATVEVARQMAASADPWPEAATIDTGAARHASLSAALAVVRGGPGADRAGSPVSRRS